MNKDHQYKHYRRVNLAPYPIFTFTNAYNWMDGKEKSVYASEGANEVCLEAEGYIEGKLVATHKVLPARRPTKIHLMLDDEKKGLKADGSDFVTVIASITDDNGNVKRLNNYKLVFEVEGEGELINDEASFTNPQLVQWGTAPALIRSTTRAGQIKVKARVYWQGANMPLPTELIFESKQAEIPLLYNITEMDAKTKNAKLYQQGGNVKSQRVDAEKLKEVEQQQKDFGEGAS